MKFGTEYNLSMMNLIVMFNFSVLYWKHLFWANLAQKFKLFESNCLFKVKFGP